MKDKLTGHRLHFCPFSFRPRANLIGHKMSWRKLIRVVRIEFPTEKPIFLTVLAIDDPYALLGRDALNQFRLLLDGPALTLEVLSSEGYTQASTT